jgi:hypothetical protein
LSPDHVRHGTAPRIGTESRKLPIGQVVFVRPHTTFALRMLKPGTSAIPCLRSLLLECRFRDDLLESACQTWPYDYFVLQKSIEHAKAGKLTEHELIEG